MLKKLLLTFTVAFWVCGISVESLAQSISNVVVSDASGGTNNFCSGTNVNVAFTTRSFPAATTFNIELSDGAGSFTAPTSLGTATASPKTVTIPAINGAAFKIRVRAVVGATTYQSESTSFRINTIPTVNTVNSQTVCANTPLTAINFSGSNATTYNWTSNANIGFGTSGTGNIGSPTVSNGTSSNVVATITVTPSNNGCLGTATSFTITVKPIPNVNSVGNASYCNGNPGAAINFSGAVASTNFAWSSTTATSVGFGTSGNGNIGTYTATNGGNAPITSTFVVTPSANGCNGSTSQFSITVNPTPTVNEVSNVSHCGGIGVPGISFSGPTAGVSYNWSSSVNVGFGANGSGNIGGYNTINGSSAVTSTVTVTPSANGCNGTARNFTVTVNPTPTMSTVPNASYCHNAAGNPISFSSTVPSTNFNWNASTNVGFNTTGTGNIAAFTANNTTANAVTSTVNVTPSIGTCTGPATSFNVTVNPTPSVNSISDLTYCGNTSGSPISFSSATPGTNFAWTSSTNVGFGVSGTGGIGAFSTIDNTTATTATVSVTPTANSCVGSPRSFTITVNPTPKVNPIANASFCSGASSPAINFSSSTAGTSFAWSTSVNVGFGTSGTGNINAYSATNGSNNPLIATVGVRGTVGACTGPTQNFTITVNPTPVISPIADLTYCGGVSGSAIGFASSASNTTYAWTSTANVGFGVAGTGNISSFSTSDNTSTTTATVSVVPTANSCVGGTRSFTVTVNPTPKINAIPNATFCNGANAPAINFGSTVAGTNFAWTATANVGFNTSGTGNIAAYTANNGSANPVTTTIGVRGTSGTCTGPAQNFTVTVNPTPVVNSLGNLTYCGGVGGSAINFGSPTPNTSFAWTSTNNVGFGTSGSGNIGGYSVITPVTAPATTTVSVTPTANTCVGSPRSFTITVNPTPVINNFPGNVEICAGGNGPALTFGSETPNTSFRWTSPVNVGFGTEGTGSVGSGYQAINPSQSPVNTTVRVIPATASCEGPARNLTYVVNPTPGNPGVTSPVIYCATAATQPLTASGSNLKWYSAATGGTGSNVAPTPEASNSSNTTVAVTNYYVSQTNGFNCESGRTTLEIRIKPLPVAPSVPKTDYQLCQFDPTLTLEASTIGANTSLSWRLPNGNISTTAPVISTGAGFEGTFNVRQFLDGCGGIGVDVKVVVRTTPPPTVSAIPIIFCQKETSRPLQATGTNLKWYSTNATGGTGSATANIPDTQVNGTYSFYVTQTGSNGCESPRAEIVVIVQPLPSATISGGASITQGQSATLTVNFTGQGPWTYTLSNGLVLNTSQSPTTITVSPLETTVFTISKITNTCGEGTPAGTATVNVKVASIDVGTPSITDLCAGKQFNVPYFSSDFFPSNTQFKVQISKSTDDGTFQTLETTGSGSPLTATVLPTATAGLYYVRVVGVATNFTVRGKISPVQITVRELPTATITGPASIYENESAKLSIAFTGENPWTVAYRDSLNQKDTTLTTTVSPFEFTVKPGKTNTYAITSISNACGSGPATSRLRLVVNPVLSIGLVQKERWLLVYPSPVSQRCTIEIQDGLTSSISISIMDISGKEVFHQSASHRDQLDLTHLAPGQYFLRAEQAGRVAQQKLLKIQ